MILQCPECKTRYLTPDNSIGSKGRTVRCAKCKHTWFVEGIKKPEGEMNDLTGMLGDINEKPKPIPPGSNLPAKRRKKASAGLIASAGIFAGLAAAIAVILFMPSLIGNPPSKNFVLTDVAMKKIEEEGKATHYEISGNIANTSNKTLPTPVLRITLVDPEGAALQYWDFSEDGKKLDGGESVPFTTGSLNIMFSRADRFVVELGSSLELALRKKP